MNLNNVSKILIVKSDRLGDILLCSGYLTALAESLPEAQIELWLSQDMAPVKSLLHPRISVKNLPFDRYLRSEPRVIQEWLNHIRDEIFDVMIIPQFTVAAPEMLVASYMPIESRYGFANYQQDLMQEWLEINYGKSLRGADEFFNGPRVEPWSSDVDKYSALAKWQGLSISDCTPRLYLSENSGAAELQRDSILIWPGATKEEFRWPESSFAEVVKKLGKEKNISIGGMEEEKGIVQELFELLKEEDVKADISLRARNDLMQTALWIRTFKLVLTNDTGIAHLAATLGCSVVAISGSQHQGRFVVRGNSALTIFAAAPCRRCNGRCIFNNKPRPCVAEIKPESVAMALLKYKGGEVQQTVDANLFKDTSVIFSSMQESMLQTERFNTKNHLENAITINKWEKLCHEAEEQRDNARKEFNVLYDRFRHILDYPAVDTRWPKISIITPSLNQGRYIEETIRSILDQQYPNFEHIVVDAGSTDDTIDILKKYPHIVWVSESDKGQAHAINKGILMSTGDIVAYLNSDDVYRPGAFKAVAETFVNNIESRIIVGNCDYIDETSKVIGFLKAKYENLEGLIRYWGWEKWFCIPQQSVFMRRSVFSEIGLFDIHYHMVMDYNMWLRIASVYPFRVMDKTLSAFRLAENSKTVSRTYEMYLEEFDASKVYWTKLSLPDRIAVAFSAHHHVAHKLLDVAEHYAFTFEGNDLTLKLVKIGMSKWPLMIINPRAWFSMIQIILSRSRFLSSVRFIHRAYLSIVWRIKNLRKSAGN